MAVIIEEPEVVSVRVSVPQPLIVKINIPGTSTTVPVFPAELPYFAIGGIKFGARTISADDEVLPTDFAIYVENAPGDVNIQLPPALLVNGKGRYLRFKKYDDNDNVVGLIPDGSDLIDGAIAVYLNKLYSEAQILCRKDGHWDNTGSAPLPGDDGTLAIGNIRIVSIDDPPVGGKIQVWDSDDFDWVDRQTYTED